MYIRILKMTKRELTELACIKASVASKIPWPEGAVRVQNPARATKYS